MVSASRCQELSPHRTELIPANSKTDALLAKAEPISSTVGTYVVTYLGKGKAHHIGAVGERSENM